VFRLQDIYQVLVRLLLKDEMPANFPTIAVGKNLVGFKSSWELRLLTASNNFIKATD
jgi:hypothetical protein